MTGHLVPLNHSTELYLKKNCVLCSVQLVATTQPYAAAAGYPAAARYAIPAAVASASPYAPAG